MMILQYFMHYRAILNIVVSFPVVAIIVKMYVQVCWVLPYYHLYKDKSHTKAKCLMNQKHCVPVRVHVNGFGEYQYVYILFISFWSSYFYVEMPILFSGTTSYEIIRNLYFNVPIRFDVCVKSFRRFKAKFMVQIYI